MDEESEVWVVCVNEFILDWGVGRVSGVVRYKLRRFVLDGGVVVVWYRWVLVSYAGKGGFVEEVLEKVEDVVVILVVLVIVGRELFCPVKEACYVFEGVEFVVDLLDSKGCLSRGDDGVCVVLLNEERGKVCKLLKEIGFGVR